MAGATEQKTDWNLGETELWRRTRNHDRVAELWEKSEFEALSHALFTPDLLPEIERRTTTPEAEGILVAPAAAVDADSSGGRGLQGDDRLEAPLNPSDRDEALAFAMAWAAATARSRRRASAAIDPAPDQILPELIRRVQTRRMRMTMFKDGERIPVSAEEANELELRISGDPLAPVVVWSRTRQVAVGTSPWFSRADVIRAWPERRKKTAAVDGAILRHLRQISTPEAPLTKDQAWKRCRDEVPNAYPAAFERAWLRLDPALKRGRGKHGIRTH
jgi:hypothetical protein